MEDIDTLHGIQRAKEPKRWRSAVNSSSAYSVLMLNKGLKRINKMVSACGF